MIRAQLQAVLDSPLGRRLGAWAAVVLEAERNGRTCYRAFISGDPEGLELAPDAMAVHDLLLREVPGAVDRLDVVPVAAIPTTPAGEPDEQVLRAMPAAGTLAAQSLESTQAQLAFVLEPLLLESPRIHRGRSAATGREGERTTMSPRAEAGGSASVPLTERRAQVEGPPLPALEQPPFTLDEALMNAAAGTQGILFLQEGEPTVSMSYRELLAQAQRAAAALLALPKAPVPVLLFLDRPEDMIVCVWGCLLAGRTPVPVGGSTAKDSLGRLQAAWNLLERPAIVTTAALLPLVAPWSGDQNVIDVRTVRQGRGKPTFVRASAENVALILLTSGSTGTPKAVPLSHRNILAQVKGSIAQNGFRATEVTLNWLSLEHAGGIIHHLRDLVLGARQLQARTEDVLVHPVRWLELVHEHRLTFAWGPNFSFGLLQQHRALLAGLELDLSSLRCIINAGEAVRMKSIQDLLQLLAPFGLPADCMVPAFGMSETSTGVTHSHAVRRGASTGEHRVAPSLALGQPVQWSEAADAISLVELGPPIPGTSLRIVDADNEVLPEGSVGRLQVRGPSVTSGYYRAPEANRAAFTSDGWFVTGDLGFLWEGRLTLTGREKDIIILNGTNFPCHELEAVAEEVPAIERSFTVACAVPGPQGQEELALFYVSQHEDRARQAEQIIELRQRFFERLRIVPHRLVPVARTDIPKTSIGKVMRTPLVQRFTAGAFDPILEALDLCLANENTLPGWFYQASWVPRAPSNTACAPGTALLVGELSQTADLRSALLAAGWRVEHVTQGAPVSAEVLASHDILIAVASPRDWVLEVLEGLPLHTVGEGRPVRLLYLLPGDLPQDASPKNNETNFSGAAEACLRTLQQEVPGLRATCVHLPAPGPAWMHAVLTELTRGDTGHVAVDWRSGRRLVQRLSRWTPGPLRGLPFARGDVVALSGGTGGIGALLVEWLTSVHGLSCLVLGRSAPAEPTGSSVLTAAADVTNAEAVQAAFLKAKSAFGQAPRGVFHLAGEAYDQPLLRTSRADAERLLATKLGGARVLTSVLRQLAPPTAQARPPFFVAFSSVNALMGGFGVGAYAAANAALASWAQWLGAESGMEAWTLDWTQWADLGMSRGRTQPELLARRGFAALTADEGLASLERVLRAPPVRLAVGLDESRLAVASQLAPPPLQGVRWSALVGPGVDLQTLETALDRAGVLPSEVERIESPELPRTRSGERDRSALRLMARSGQGASSSSSVRPLSVTEESLSVLWSAVLRCRPPLPTSNFFALGGHSRLAAELISKLPETFGVELPLSALFDAPTLERFAAALDEALRRAS